MKILRRIYVALVMTVLAVGAIAMFLFHTGTGRELVRAQLEHKLGAMFVGKVSVGSVEGDPFGEMTVHDLAVDDKDGHPAIRAQTIRVRMSMLALARRVVHVDRLIVDGAEIHVAKSSDGKLELAQLMQKKPRSEWSFELPDMRLANARVITQDETIDALEIRGRLSYPFGKPLVASLAASATWRGAPTFAIASVRQDDGGWRIPHALVASHGILIAADGAELRGKQLTGSAIVDASKADAQRYGLNLPDDIRALASLDSDRRISAAGHFGTTPMQIVARVDLEAKRVSGLAIADQYQLPRGRFGGVATFDLAMGPDGGLPIGTAFAQLRADVPEAPDARVGLAMSSDGTTAHLAIDATSRGSKVLLGGDLARAQKLVSAHGARLIASGVFDGTPLRADLVASGPLFPKQDLSVAGRIDAGGVKRSGFVAKGAHLVVDAHHVPAQPTGSAKLHVDGLARGNWMIGAVDATVKTLTDGKLAIGVDALDDHLDAQVQYKRGGAAIALGHHRLRAPDGAIWQGDGGRIEITPAKIVATDLHSASRFGLFELAGSYDRHSRKLVGDATAKSPLVDAFSAHVALTVPRTRDWRGAIDQATIRATGIHAEPALLSQLHLSTRYGATIDVSADVDRGARGGKLVASIHKLHGDRLAQPLDLRIEADTDADRTRAQIALRGPAGVNLGDLDVTFARPAEAIRADAPITGTLVLTGAPAPMYAAVLGRESITGGLIAGKIAVSGTLAKPALDGELVATNVMTPATHGGTVLAVLDELRVKGSFADGALAVRVDGRERQGGTLSATARGRIDEPKQFQLGFRAKAFDLAPVLALIPGPAAGGLGKVDADLTMTGLDLRDARLAGTLHVTEGRLPLSPTIGTLRRADFTATLDGQTARLTLDAMLGQGTLKGSGTIALTDGVPSQGEIVLHARKIEPIGIMHPEISADATGKVRREGKKWLIDLVVEHGRVVIPRSPVTKLHEVGAPAEMVFVQGGQPKRITKLKELPVDPSFVLDLELKPTTIIDRDMKGSISGKLLISDDHARIGMLGDLTAAKGDVDLFGRRYVVERASLHFDGSNDPLLDVRLSHDFTDVVTTTTIRGRFSHPDIAMSSSPSVYTQGQLLGFLLGGEPQGDPRDVAARDRATNAGASLISNEIGTYVRGALPLKIDVIRYNSGSPESSAAVTAGTWITHDLFLAYRRHLEARPDENANESDLEYWLTHHLSVEGTAGDRGYDGIDLLWRTRY